MITTHEDIKRKYFDNIEKTIARTTELQRAGQLLLKSYRESLSLPSDMFVDGNGNSRTYVMTGFRDGNRFQTKSISAMELDDLCLTFIISTVIDETSLTGIQYAHTRISIYKEVGAYHFQVGSRKKDFKIVSINASDAFFAVNEEIKNCVIESVYDPRLDY